MADRADPKLSLAPLREPAPAPLAGDDLVAELARTVSGRSIVDHAAATGNRTVPFMEAVSSDGAPTSDLETTLLNDLEAVSSAFYSLPALGPSTPPWESLTAAPKPDADAAPAKARPSMAAAPVALAERGAGPWEGPAIAVPSRPERRTSPVSLPRPWRRVPVASPADRPPFGPPLTDALGRVAKEEPKTLSRPATATPPAAGTATVRLGDDQEDPAAKWSAVTSDPSRFAAIAHRAALFRPKAGEPQKDESRKVTASGGGDPAEEHAAPSEDRDAVAHCVEDAEPPHPGEITDLSRRSLFIGGAPLAVVLAAGVTYMMVQSEKPLAIPPIVAADPAKLGPIATPADNDREKNLIRDRVDGAQSADQTKLVTPGNGKLAEVPASSGDDNHPISGVIGSASPGFDQAAKSDDAAAPGDHAAAVGPSASGAGGAAPSSEGGAATAEDASAVPGAPAMVPIPRIKPAVLPTKAGRPLSAPAVAASSGGLY